jgi:hypothetical protein
MQPEPFRISQPEIVSVGASLVTNGEAHATWAVGYAPEPDETGGRVLIAYLHARVAHARVDVEVASTLLGGAKGEIADGEPSDAFSAALGTAEAVTTLYDIARITAQGLLGTIGTQGVLPKEPPVPQVTRLVRNEVVPVEGQKICSIAT